MISVPDRTAAFALAVIILYRDIQFDAVGRIIGRQLLRSGTSIGANVEEAQGAQSRRDFVAKYSIAHKEARETRYWLKLLQDSRIVSDKSITDLLAELEQILKIIASSLLTAKKSLV